MKVINLTLFLFLCCLSLKAQTPKKALKLEDDVRSKEYYQKFGSDVERLHKLRCGVFVLHYEDSLGTLVPWYVNMNEDSVLLYTTPVGNISKDGYWLYHYQLMTNLPDMPIYNALEHIIAHSRDSFEGVFYKCPITVKLEDLQAGKKNPLEKINFKGLEKIDEHIIYRRINYTEFYGYTEPYFLNPSDKPSNTYTVDFYKMSVDHIRLYSMKIDSKFSLETIGGLNPLDVRFNAYLLRFYPEEISIFAELLKSRNKKKGK